MRSLKDILINQFFSIRKKLPIIYLIPTVCLTISMQLGLRQLLFEKYGVDSILAGSIPNFIAVVLISLTFNFLKNDKKDATPLKMSLMGTAAMVFYESVQPLIQGRTFDWFDVLASLIGGLFVYIILSLAQVKDR